MIGKYLITADSYFVAPDGKQYKAVWGKVEILEDSFLGIKTNRNASNWYIKIGTIENHVIIAGCQIHYAVKCDNKPNDGVSEDWVMDAPNGLIVSDKVPSKIYIADA